MNNEKQGEVAFSVHNQIIENEKQRRSLFLQNMELIHEMHNKQYYKSILGDDEAPWSAYLGQHEVFYSASKVYTMDKIYSKFVKELEVDIDEISDIPSSKLSNLLSVVNRENVSDWLTKARVLTTQDFEDELRKAQGKISYLECPHNFKEYEICAKCGFRHRK